MGEYRFTEYFDKEVLRKRPYLKRNGVFKSLRIHSKLNLRSIIVFGFGV